MHVDLSRLARVARRLAGDGRWRRYYLQRYVRRPTARRAVSRAVARFRPRPMQRPADEAQIARLATLIDDGIVVMPSFADPSQVSELKAHLSSLDCYDPDRPVVSGAPWPALATPGCVHAYYKVEDLLKAPHVLTLANDARLLELVSGVFGCRPTICEINCWWLNHNIDPEIAKLKHDGFVLHQNREYHRDIDDWAMLRFFLYLTDVDHGGGPHSYIPGTHRLHLGRERGIRFESDADTLLQTRLDVIGPGGTAILMDPYGLHRGTVPTSSDRLVLSFTYSLGTTNTFAPRQPLAPKPDGLNSYENRLFLRP